MKSVRVVEAQAKETGEESGREDKREGDGEGQVKTHNFLYYHA